MYEIKVLSNEEFDSLPMEETRGSDISDSLGFANRDTGRAYVRQTGIHDLNKYLISHELEELESDHSTHEDENGIRHKRRNFFTRIFNPLNFQGALGLGTGDPNYGIGYSAKKDKPENVQADQQQAIQQQIQSIQPQAPQEQVFQPQPQAPIQSSGSSGIPALNSSPITGQAASQFSPLSGFQGSINQNPSDINPDTLQRLKGFYPGRQVF